MQMAVSAVAPSHSISATPSQSLSGVVRARYAQDPGLEDVEEFFGDVDEARLAAKERG